MALEGGGGYFLLYAVHKRKELAYHKAKKNSVTWDLNQGHAVAGDLNKS